MAKLTWDCHPWCSFKKTRTKTTKAAGEWTNDKRGQGGKALCMLFKIWLLHLWTEQRKSWKREFFPKCNAFLSHFIVHSSNIKSHSYWFWICFSFQNSIELKLNPISYISLEILAKESHTISLNPHHLMQLLSKFKMHFPNCNWQHGSQISNLLMPTHNRIQQKRVRHYS